MHRTEKPISLLKGVLEMAKINGIILDPFMGSGSTGIASVETGRSFIGCEMTAQYFSIAEERITMSKSQGQLFQAQSMVASSANKRLHGDPNRALLFPA